MIDPINNPYGVKVGQIWESCDKRDAGRRVTVEHVSLGFAYVRYVKLSRVRLTRFRPTSTGYRLVKDVPSK